jgi:glutamyl-tRNA synthetase/glutamyl-Q tRNA(Asp) synthetase
VVNALWVWGLAAAGGGRVLLRIEDHDRVRCRIDWERSLLEDLEWLGLEPDEGPDRQSDRGALYERHLNALVGRGLVYACRCTRREIVEAGGEGEELHYPGTCRELGIDAGSTPMRRVRLDGAEIEFEDLGLGRQRQTPARQCGDLLARDRDANWTYQFAVTIDDLEQGVDLVIRGSDLLASTGRQIELSRLLGRLRPPRFLHHGLILRADGSKLSKANRDEGVRDLRAAGWSAERVLGAAAHAAGLLPEAGAVGAGDLGELLAETPVPS